MTCEAVRAMGISTNREAIWANLHIFDVERVDGHSSHASSCAVSAIRHWPDTGVDACDEQRAQGDAEDKTRRADLGDKTGGGESTLSTPTRLMKALQSACRTCTASKGPFATRIVAALFVTPW